jgi:UDP-GlcNAc:undecaprenyl-phosphate/decaprenyl-phosphate GlcNAc-1-phosphate transferase
VSEGLRLAATFLVAALLPSLTVPAAIAVARRTGFLDTPRDYKAHRSPTPYLGGAAVLLAALVTMGLLGVHLWSDYWPLLVGAVGLGLVGTLDDRVNLSPLLRVATEILAAWLLWRKGLGWSFLSGDVENFALTAFWVTGIVNAFNLMDNLDGAASSVAAVSSACVGILAVIGHDVAMAVIAAALCGALLGFLRFNLARPARIFLGDGGSMAIGFLIAAALMSAPMGAYGGWATVATAALAAGMPVFDTILVVISRRRRGAQILSGATDHTTHRLLTVLKSPQAVACALAGAQTGLCALAIGATRIGDAALVIVACVALVLAAATVAFGEGLDWMPVSDDS